MSYDPKRVYGKGENVPRHGGHHKKKSKPTSEIFSQRGVVVPGTGKPKGADKG